MVVLALVWVARLKPAAPAVERTSLSFDSVISGPMVREVRAPGSLVPEQIRWISAVALGRVERQLVQPGEKVTTQTILMELSGRTPKSTPVVWFVVSSGRQKGPFGPPTHNTDAQDDA